jgi:hypothetical protein
MKNDRRIKGIYDAARGLNRESPAAGAGARGDSVAAFRRATFFNSLSDQETARLPAVPEDERLAAKPRAVVKS